MARPSFQKTKLMAAGGLLSVTLLAGCSNPLSGPNDIATEEAIIEATPTSAPPMPIITPTPVDPTAVAAAADETPGPAARPDSYVVAENDTLYEIAAQFGIDISQLVEVNNLSDPNDIFVGQELIIPPEE